MKKIKLSNGAFALVDDEDFNLLNKYKWQAGAGYAQRKEWLRNEKKYKTILMHRKILMPPKNMYIDHINGNRLDNRRANLRIVTPQQNQWNQKISKRNKLGIQGVRFCLIKGQYKNTAYEYPRYRASIAAGKKAIYLGTYKSLQAACLARKWGERLYFKY